MPVGKFSSLASRVVKGALKFVIAYHPLSQAVSDTNILDFLIVDQHDAIEIDWDQARSMALAGQIDRKLTDTLSGSDSDSPVTAMNIGILQVAAGQYQQGATRITTNYNAVINAASPNSLHAIQSNMAAAIAHFHLLEFDRSEKKLIATRQFIETEQLTTSNALYFSLEYLSRIAYTQERLQEADQLQREKLAVAEGLYKNDIERLTNSFVKTGSYFTVRGSSIPVVTLNDIRLTNSTVGSGICGLGGNLPQHECIPGLNRLQSDQFNRGVDARSLKAERDKLFSESIQVFNRAIALHQQHLGSAESNYARTLRYLANAHDEFGQKRKAEAILQQAIQVAETDPRYAEEKFRALLSLGDLLLLDRGISKAETHYKHAWQLLQENTALAQRYSGQFSSPKRIAPKRFTLLPIEESTGALATSRSRFAVVEFDVSKKGRALRIHFTEENIPKAQQRDLKRQLQRAKYRPKIASGELVESKHHSHRFEYSS